MPIHPEEVPESWPVKMPEFTLRSHVKRVFVAQSSTTHLDEGPMKDTGEGAAAGLFEGERLRVGAREGLAVLLREGLTDLLRVTEPGGAREGLTDLLRVTEPGGREGDADLLRETEPDLVLLREPVTEMGARDEETVLVFVGVGVEETVIVNMHTKSKKNISRAFILFP